jgi:membrane protein YdbS with pleckstrin-like domain
MRSLQRSYLARAAVAFLTSVALTLLAWQAGPAIMLASLFTVLLIVTFALLTAAPDLIAYQRKHPWRWWWRSSDDEGPFWPGTRVPRHTR